VLLKITFPMVEPDTMVLPNMCPRKGCKSDLVFVYQRLQKPLTDFEYNSVEILRAQCLICKRTFRVYPRGVNLERLTQRVKELAIVLDLLGLSYREITIVLRAFGVSISRSRLYETRRKRFGKNLTRRVDYTCTNTTDFEIVSHGFDFKQIVGIRWPRLDCLGLKVSLELRRDDTESVILLVTRIVDNDYASDTSGLITGFRNWIAFIVSKLDAELSELHDRYYL
jgi:hypothetical protein